MNWSTLRFDKLNYVYRGPCTPPPNSRDLLCSWSQAPTLSGAKALNDGLGRGLANRFALVDDLGMYKSHAGNEVRVYTGSSTRSLTYYLQDWYIPTLTEAVELCKYANGNPISSGGCTPGSLKSEFTADNYWTSNPASPGVGTNATALHFGTGVAASLDRTSLRLVRPIRAFAGTIVPSAMTAATTIAPTTTVRAATTTVAPATTTIAPTTTVLSCALGGPCAVGNTGPGGGTVIYANAAGFACGASRTSTCRYLEAAVSTWHTTISPSITAGCNTDKILTCPWSDKSIKLTGTGNTGIGYGLQNTNAMLAQSLSVGSAAVVARAYRGGAKDDWFLPSIDELEEVCKYAKSTRPSSGSVCPGGMIKLDMANMTRWWSSNDTTTDLASAKDFYSPTAIPTVKSNLKSNKLSILPIRAF